MSAVRAACACKKYHEPPLPRVVSHCTMTPARAVHERFFSTSPCLHCGATRSRPHLAPPHPTPPTHHHHQYHHYHRAGGRGAGRAAGQAGSAKSGGLLRVPAVAAGEWRLPRSFLPHPAAAFFPQQQPLCACTDSCVLLASRSCARSSACCVPGVSQARHLLGSRPAPPCRPSSCGCRSWAWTPETSWAAPSWVRQAPTGLGVVTR